MEDQRHDYSRNNNNNRNKEALYPTPEGLELKSFKSFLTWVCLDQSNKWRAGLSASIFFVLVIGVPIVTHFVFSCSSCDAKHRRPYDGIVQLSLSFIAALSFYSLSSFAHTYGLRRFLFLDKLGDASEKVRQEYTQQLRVSFSLIFFITHVRVSIRHLNHLFRVLISPFTNHQCKFTKTDFETYHNQT